MRTHDRDFRWVRRSMMLAAGTLLVACASKEEDPVLSGSSGAAAGAGGDAASSGSAGMPASGGSSGTSVGTSGGSSGRGAGAGGVSGSGGASAAGGASASGGAGMSATGGAGAGTTGGAGGAAGRGMAGSGGGGSGKAGGAGTAGSAGSGDPSDHSAEATCARWNADRADMGEGTWSGNIASCDPGDISADGRANALKIVNLYRWLAQLPEVTTSDDRNLIAQACALVMDANNDLSHDPPMDWTCWTDDAHEGASTSNISSGPGVSSIDLYMGDNGNEDTLGHRRWVMSNSLGPIGLGSTGAMGASCMQNLTGTGKAGKEWQAWPPPGVLPFQAVKPGRFGGSFDDTGWSVQSDKIKLDSATVTVTSGGTDMPVTVNQLPGGYGSSYAISIVPDGWQTTAGQIYSVSVGGTLTPIAYDVNVVDCAN